MAMRARLLVFAAVAIGVTVLIGCGSRDKEKVDAAKAAIAADSDLEIVATNEATA